MLPRFLAQRIIATGSIASISPSASRSSLAVSGLLAEKKVLSIIPVGDPRVLDNLEAIHTLVESNLVVLAGPPLSKEGQALEAILRKVVKANRIVIATDDSPLSNYYAQAAQSYLQSHGTSSQMAEVSRAIKEMRPDAVYAPTSGTLQVLLKSASEEKWRGTIIAGAGGLAAEDRTSDWSLAGVLLTRTAGTARSPPQALAVLTCRCRPKLRGLSLNVRAKRYYSNKCRHASEPCA